MLVRHNLGRKNIKEIKVTTFSHLFLESRSKKKNSLAMLTFGRLRFQEEAFALKLADRDDKRGAEALTSNFSSSSLLKFLLCDSLHHVGCYWDFKVTFSCI